jgi:hypothetical protein
MLGWDEGAAYPPKMTPDYFPSQIAFTVFARSLSRPRPGLLNSRTYFEFYKFGFVSDSVSPQLPFQAGIDIWYSDF